MAALVLQIGCGKSKVDQALESDANGYQCLGCKTKFYTSRDVFADVCPQCKKPNIAPVVGFVCSNDQHVTIAPRGRGFLACEKCGRSTSALMIPGEKELQIWGATKRAKNEVSGF